MSNRSVLAIFRQLSEAGPPATDADLLGRFIANRDEEAFALLVRRHGRLVWAVCQNLAGADADDAFQATFLVLLRNASKVRKANNLSAWLHGVAYRVCSKARLAAKRRGHREQAVASKDGNVTIVPDSAWDRAMAAVHEEVARLPETLRVPFVLCSLEGKCATEAAALLGCKLGTLTSRLTRAKDALLARLDARGLGAGVIATMVCTTATVPAEAMTKAAELVQVGLTIPGSILSLTQGVLGMGTYHVKMLAAGVLLACGLGVGGGAGWLANAEAQVAPPAAPKMSPDEKVRQLERQLEQAKREAAEAREAKARDELRKALIAQQRAMETVVEGIFPTAKWEYSFLPANRSADANAKLFVATLGYMETSGWDFAGEVTFQKNDKDAPMWVFRRPLKKNTGNTSNSVPPRADNSLPATNQPRNAAPLPRVDRQPPVPESPRIPEASPLSPTPALPAPPPAPQAQEGAEAPSTPRAPSPPTSDPTRRDSEPPSPPRPERSR